MAMYIKVLEYKGINTILRKKKLPFKISYILLQ